MSLTPRHKILRIVNWTYYTWSTNSTKRCSIFSIRRDKCKHWRKRNRLFSLRSNTSLIVVFGGRKEWKMIFRPVKRGREKKILLTPGQIDFFALIFSFFPRYSRNAASMISILGLSISFPMMWIVRIVHWIQTTATRIQQN